MIEFFADKLKVKVYKQREEMGIACALDLISEINRVIDLKKECRIIFAAAPSQNDLLRALRKTKEIDFSKVVAFHMDEYHTLPHDSDKRFKYFLSNALFSYQNFKKVYYLCDDETKPINEQIAQYESLLLEKPIDITICGIGENGHLAFNEPAYADFNDPKVIKEIELDEVCRNQQFIDAKYESIDLVPHSALTLTIPTLLNVGKIFCIVPTIRKHEAVMKTLKGEISPKCPSSILRTKGNCTLYLDELAYKGE